MTTQKITNEELQTITRFVEITNEQELYEPKQTIDLNELTSKLIAKIQEQEGRNTDD